MKKYGLVLFLAASLLLTGCGQKQIDAGNTQKGDSVAMENNSSVAPKSSVTLLTPEEAQKVMAGSEPFVLLDVRTEEEFAEGFIPGAVLIPDYELAGRAPAELPDKNAKILVYCRSGRRSAGAAQMLADMGYTNIFDFGGILDWPFDIVTE